MMDAVVTAGGIPEPGDPLYPFTQGANKALLDVAGKPMIQWLMDALSASVAVDRVIVTGLPETVQLPCTKPVIYLPDQGDMLDNLGAGVKELLRTNPKHRQVLILSSDVPAIKSEMIDWLIGTIQGSDLDIYYNVIPQALMEKRFPGSRRTYTRLKDAVFTGGDANAINTRIFASEKPLWGKIISARKSPVKQAALIGFDTVFLLLIRQLSLDKAVKIITQRLGVTGKALVCPYAEMGMDVDKPHQLELMRGPESPACMKSLAILDKDCEWSARLRLGDEKSWLRSLAVFFAHSGDSWFWLAGLLLVWLFSKGSWHNDAALTALAILALAGGVMVVKTLVRRPRPEGEWGAIYRRMDPHSFPSGHAARAALLVVLACGLVPAWLAVVLVVWAPLVCLAWVAMGVHYLSDIVVGAGLGLIMGLLVLALQPFLLSLLHLIYIV